MIHPFTAVARRTLLAAGVATPLAGAVAGCTGDSGAAVRADVDKIRFVTGFNLFGREAGVFVADKLGMFAEQHIEVEIESGEGAASNTALVASGAAQFSLTDLSGLIVLAGSGSADAVRAVAAVHQLALIGFFALADSGINTPKDLEGTAVADSSASVGRLLWQSYADLAEIDTARVELVDAAPPQLPTLLATRTVDAIGQFAVGQPLIEDAADGRETVFLPYSDLLTELYGIALITHTDLIESNPDLVRRFGKALFGGIEYALDHPEEAGRILAEAAPEQDPQVAAAELQIMDVYVRQPDAPLGGIDEIRVAQSIALLEATGAVPAGMTADQIVSFDLVPTG